MDLQSPCTFEFERFKDKPVLQERGAGRYG